MELIFIKDEKELGFLISGRTEEVDFERVVPLMPKAALALLDMGFRGVRLPIDLLTKDEREGINQKAIDLSRSWYHSFSRSVTYKGIDLLDCCRLQMLGFFQDLIAADMIASRIIKEYQPKRVRFLSSPSIPSFGHTMHDGTSDVFTAVLQWRFMQEGIRVATGQQGARDKKQSGLAAAVFGYAGRGLGLCRRALKTWKAIHKEPKRVTLEDIPEDRNLLVGYGSGYDLMIIFRYLKALAAETNSYPLLVNASPDLDVKTLRSGLGIAEDFHYIYINDIPLRPSDRASFKAVRSAISEGVGGNESVPVLLQNPLLRFQFDLLRNSLIPAALDAVERAMSLFTLRRVAMYLDDYCAGHTNRAWIEVGNLLGIPTAYAPHGAVNLVEFHEFNAQWALATGELVRQNLVLACPEKEGRVIVSGDPIMAKMNAGESYQKESPRDSVVFLTGGFLHQAWTDMDLTGFVSTWEGIAQVAQNRPFVKFSIKPHPSVRDLGDWYRRFMQKRNIRNIEVIDNQRLEDMLGSAFLAVLLGKPGTAGVVATLSDVPFVYYDTMLCREVLGYKIWRRENGVPILRSTSELADMIDSVYLRPESKENLLERNRLFLPIYSHPFEPAEVRKLIGL